MPVVKETSAPRNPVPQGTHHAICYGVIDLGTQQPPPNSKFSNKSSRKVLLMFEVPDERLQIEKDGEHLDLPRAISKEFRMSLHEKAGLRKFLVAWRGRQFSPEELQGFDLATLAGVNCMLGVVHKENGYEDISTCMKLPKGMQARQAENELIVYDIDKPIPASLPEWVRNKIARSDEHQVNGGSGPNGHPPPPPGYEEDDIPF